MQGIEPWRDRWRERCSCTCGPWPGSNSRLPAHRFGCTSIPVSSCLLPLFRMELILGGIITQQLGVCSGPNVDVCSYSVRGLVPHRQCYRVDAIETSVRLTRLSMQTRNPSTRCGRDADPWDFLT